MTAPKRRKGRLAPPDRTCGDEGGITAETGQPCARQAGWGTGRRTGRCKMHNTPALETLARQKSEFLAAFGEGTIALQEATRRIGYSVSAVWRWRQADPEFDRAVTEAQAHADNVRVGLVEDSVFRRIIAGEASPAETIFFLKNRGFPRWRDRHELTGRDGGPLVVRFVDESAPTQVTDEDGE